MNPTSVVNCNIFDGYTDYTATLNLPFTYFSGLIGLMGL